MKIKRFFNWHFVTAFVAAACVVSACGEDDVKPEKPTTPEETIIEEPLVDHIDYVYAAFNEQINRKWVASTSQPGGGVARMSDGTKNALVTSQCIGKDFSLYAAGSEENSKGQHYAKYWVNCSQVVLVDSTSSTLFSQASDIAVSGDNVYVAGVRYNGEHTVALYWDNGTPVDLTSGKTDAEAKEIFISGDDVYVAGIEKDDKKNPVAKLWKNGKEVVVGGSYATSLFVDGEDVYVAGNFGNDTMYWKNGSLVTLLNGTQKQSDAIFIAEGSVYVAGAGSYWKDAATFSLIKDGNIPKLTSIFVVGDDVYVGGAESNGSRDVARYWKNGEPVDLTDGSEDAVVTSIVVMRFSVN